jgi:biopolymer transport protein TolR
MAFSASDDALASEINVTPFVDVMLVLLIIFMVAAPMMTEGLAVELPQVRAADVLPTEKDHLILTIKSDGGLFLEETPIAAAMLEEALATLVAAPKKQLFLRADKMVSHGAVMEVMGHIRAAGVEKIGMVAESAEGAFAESAHPSEAASASVSGW